METKTEGNFGDYEIVREIGEGGFSMVYLANPKGLENTKVAIKRPKNPDDKSQVSRLWQEAEALDALIGKEHIVAVRNYHANDSIPSLALEYCDSSLERKLSESRDRKLPWREAVEITKQILEGLRVVHATPKVGYHADLKPSNVLLQNNNGREVVKLADFGAQTGQRMPSQSIAHLGSIVEKGEATAMTLAYHTREQLNGERVTSATDIHQTGQILYEMISGNNFRMTEGRELPSKHNAPKWLDEIVFKMTDPSQASRPNVKQALEYLQKGLEGKFDGPTFFQRATEKLKSAGRKIDRSLDRVVDFGKKAIFTAACLSPIWAIAGYNIYEYTQEKKTIAEARQRFTNSNESLVYFSGTNMVTMPLESLLEDEQKINVEKMHVATSRITGFDDGRLIYIADNNYGSDIFSFDFKTRETTRLYDSLAEANREFLGARFEDGGLVNENGEKQIVERIGKQWYRIAQGKLEQLEQTPEKFDNGYSMNSVPNSNIVFTSDFFKNPSIVIERADSYYGDKEIKTPAPDTGYGYVPLQNVFVIPYKPVEGN